MKKAFSLVLIFIGTFLTINFGYIFLGFAVSNPLFQWTIFVEPMIFSAGLILLGVLLIALGMVL
jgi:hypothetical protein